MERYILSALNAQRELCSRRLFQQSLSGLVPLADRMSARHTGALSSNRCYHMGIELLPHGIYG
jgi:hypothetical protein